MNQGRHVVIIALGVCTAGVLATISPQIPDVMAACAPKIGRVIDSATGKGMPDVFVLTSASFEAGPLVHGSPNRTVYNIVVRTDADGGYSLPSFWSKAVFGIPGTNPAMRWSVTAFEPGFVVVGDEDGWRFDEKGEAFFPAKSASETPEAHWSGSRILVHPIAMRSASLSIPEAAAYYRKVLIVGAGQRGIQSVEETELRDAAHGYLRDLVCRTDPTVSVDMRTARYLLAFSSDRQHSEQRLRAIDPAKWASLSYSHALPYSANEICDAMRAGG